MTTNTIILIAVAAVVAIVVIAVIAVVARGKRTQHHRVEAADIRDKAAEQSHKVGQREALADETAAKARAAQAEADAKAAHAAGLQHQAQIRRSDAASARDEVNQEFDRANKVDPDVRGDDTVRTDSTTDEPAQQASNGKQRPPVMPKAGSDSPSVNEHASTSTATEIVQNSTFERFARIGFVVSGLLHLAIGYLAIRIALGSGVGNADQSGAFSAVAAQPGGTVALIAGGVVIVAVGGYHIYKGASQNFLGDLKGTSSDLVRRLGTAGYIAKGLAIAGAGMLVIVAASLKEPGKATGIDGALKTLGAQPYGAALLIAAGLGIITYGLYSFAMAQYTKM